MSVIVNQVCLFQCGFCDMVQRSQWLRWLCVVHRGHPRQRMDREAGVWQSQIHELRGMPCVCTVVLCICAHESGTNVFQGCKRKFNIAAYVSKVAKLAAAVASATKKSK